MSLDPHVPPHRTKAFWYLVALALMFGVGYPFAVRSREPLSLQFGASIATSIMMILIGWFAVHRLQRDSARGIKPSVRPTRFRLIMLGLAAVFLLVSFFMRRHSPQPTHFRPAQEKPDYIKKLEEWKP